MSFNKKEYHKNYHKIWYKNNLEKRKEQLKEYQEKHRPEQVKRVQKYVLNHKEKVNQYNKKFNQTIEGKYRMLLYRAKKWGLPYLTKEDFEILFNLPCVYCGETEEIRGIDRIDNHKGYTKENSAPACKQCNFMKKTMNVENFLSHIKKIYNFNNK